LKLLKRIKKIVYKRSKELY